jgi:ribosomal protein L1
LIKEISDANFDPSVGWFSNLLECDPRKANQMVRVVTLPHGTGKDVAF